MKKVYFKLIMLVLLCIICNYFNNVIVKAEKTTLGSNEIGTIKDGKVIFYANLIGVPNVNPIVEFRAEPHSMGYELIFEDGVFKNNMLTDKYGTIVDYYYGDRYPDTRLIVDTDPTRDLNLSPTYFLTGGFNDSVNFSYSSANKTMSPDNTMVNYKMTNPATLSGVEVNVNYQIVEGLSGEKDLLRYDYAIKNTSGATRYIALQTNTDTYLGASPYYTDTPVFVVDNADKWVYDNTLNPGGFIQPGGKVTRTIRFIQRDDNADNHLGINGVPEYIQNIMSFNENNPITSYYGFKPDKQTESGHIYNMPNVLDLGHFTNRYTIMNTNQKSGYITADIDSTPTDFASAGDSATTDSAINIQWNKTAVAAGETIHFVYFVGNGKYDVTALDTLNASISVQNNGVFTRDNINNDIINPLDVDITLLNTDTTNKVGNVNVKLAYDPLEIRLIDTNGDIVPYDPLKVVNTTINGVTDNFPYIEQMGIDLETSGQDGDSSNFKFKIVGINNTTSNLNSYVKGVVSFSKSNDPVVKSFGTKDYKLTIPGALVAGVPLTLEYLKFSDSTEVLPSNVFRADVVEGVPYKVYAEYVPGYTLKDKAKVDGVEVSLKPSDPYISFTNLGIPKKIQFYYEQLGTVKVNHWLLAGATPDPLNDTLLLNETIVSIDGTLPANTLSWGEFGNYTLISKTGDNQPYTIDGTNEINFYYAQKDKGIGNILVRHVEDGTDYLINHEFMSGTYGNNFNAKPMTDGFLGYKLVAGQDPIDVTFSKDLQIVTYKYVRNDDYKGSIIDTKADIAIVMVSHNDKDKTSNAMFSSTRYLVPLFEQTDKNFNLTDAVLDFSHLGYILSDNPNINTPIALIANNAINAIILYEKLTVTGNVTFWLGATEVTDSLEPQTYIGRAFDTVDFTGILMPIDKTSLLDPKPRYVLDQNTDAIDGVYLYPPNNETLKVYVMIDPGLIADLTVKFVDVWGNLIDTKTFPGYVAGTPIYIKDADFDEDYNMFDEDERTILFTDNGGGTLTKTIEVYPAKVNANITFIDKEGNAVTEVTIDTNVQPLNGYTITDISWGTVITDYSVLEKVDNDIPGFKQTYEIKYVNGIHTITLDRNGPFDTSLNAFKISATVANKNGGSTNIIDPKPIPKSTPDLKSNSNENFDQKSSGKETTINNNTSNNTNNNITTKKDEIKVEQNLTEKTKKILLQDMSRETQLKVMIDEQNKLISLRDVEFNKPYVFGYGDTTIKPTTPITRAELAEMIYSLYYKPIEHLDTEKELNFSDVKKDDWYLDAINFVNKFDIMIGYGDGTFRPQNKLTRAEFVKVIVKLNKMATDNEEVFFKDVVGNWAEPYILAAYKIGLIFGYEDGTFRPDIPINRAEVINIINRTLDRNKFYSNINTFSDLPKSEWYYDDVMNAANEIILE